MINNRINKDHKIDNELELIIQIIRIKEKPFKVEGIKLSKNINWVKFVKLCTYHGTIPIAYKKLKTLEPGFIPENIVSRLKKLYQQIVQWNLVQSNQLIKVLKILNENNIHAIPIKGPVISMQAYGDIGFRMFQDLDILISHRDFISVFNLLCLNGYQPSRDLSAKRKKLWKRYRRDIEFKKNKTLIDIHQRITQAHSAFDLPDDQFKEKNFVEILNNKVPVLSLEETILYLIINSTKDQWNMLRMIADLSFLIHSNPEIKWDYVLERSKNMGIRRMMLTGLYLISKITVESLPGLIRSEIEKDKRIEDLSNNYRDQLLFKSGGNKTLDRVKSISDTLDSTYHKFRYMLYFIFTPTPEDFKWLSLPESIFFLYRIIRPIRLLVLGLRRRKMGS